MKRIGQLSDDKVLHVTTIVNIDDDFTYGMAHLAKPPLLTIKIEFLFKVNGLRSHSYELTMQARTREEQYDECLKDELRQSAIWDRKIWDSSVPAAFDRHGWTLQIDDAAGVLSWFGLDAASDLFNQQTQINDKPVRLPAPDPK